jgi:hypothetical protein
MTQHMRHHPDTPGNVTRQRYADPCSKYRDESGHRCGNERHAIREEIPEAGIDSDPQE